MDDFSADGQKGAAKCAAIEVDVPDVLAAHEVNALKVIYCI